MGRCSEQHAAVLAVAEVVAGEADRHLGWLVQLVDEDRRDLVVEAAVPEDVDQGAPLVPALGAQASAPAADAADFDDAEDPPAGAAAADAADEVVAADGSMVDLVARAAAVAAIEVVVAAGERRAAQAAAFVVVLAAEHLAVVEAGHPEPARVGWERPDAVVGVVVVVPVAELQPAPPAVAADGSMVDLVARAAAVAADHQVQPVAAAGAAADAAAFPRVAVRVLALEAAVVVELAVAAVLVAVAAEGALVAVRLGSSPAEPDAEALEGPVVAVAAARARQKEPHLGLVFDPEERVAPEGHCLVEPDDQVAAAETERAAVVGPLRVDRSGHLVQGWEDAEGSARYCSRNHSAPVHFRERSRHFWRYFCRKSIVEGWETTNRRGG